jgi:cytochrome c-type biogenesis protein CcmF
VIGNLGYFALVITFFLALYGAGAAVYGAVRKRPVWVESARRAMQLTWPLISLAVAALLVLLINQRYEYYYVARVVNNDMPAYLRITALWGSQAGSLVFWAWTLAAFTSIIGLRKWDRDREFLPWVALVNLVTLAFFLGLVVFLRNENPFARLWQTVDGQQMVAMFQPGGTLPLIPINGNGMDPLLQHPGMIIHPPMLYLGFVAFTIPFAFAIAALVTRRTDDRWIRVTRRWTLVAWLFLSLGLLLGARWAYDVLGWGGYWGWDPVEIAALLPWLTGTAFLHSVIVQEKRGMLKHWNMVLIILTYCLVIFGTFLTRSGVLSSVHAFAQSAIGPLFFGFIVLIFLGSLGLLVNRWSGLRGENRLGSLLARESLFLFSNLFFMAITVICIWGVLFPVLSELVTGQQVTVGPPYYERAIAPLAFCLLILMAVAPLSVYGKVMWRRLGKSLLKPVAVSLVVPLALLLGGFRHVGALVGYWLIGCVVLVTLYEVWRGALARRKRHGERLPVALWRLAARNRRRYGGYVIHLGVALMAIGIIGMELFQTETQGTLAPGEQLSLAGYTMEYQNTVLFNADRGKDVARASVVVSRDGAVVGELFPRIDYHLAAQRRVTIPGLHSTLEDDFYVLLVGVEPPPSGTATFKVYHNPQVNLMWLGGGVFIVGTLIAAWPDKEPEPARATRRVRRASSVRA